jgi:hypothetical protein
MSLSIVFKSGVLAAVLVAASLPVHIASAQTTPAARPGQTVRIVGVVRDEANAIALPGVPVEVVGTAQVVYTDVDGRYILELPPGTHQIKVLLDGYQEKLINVEAGTERSQTMDVGLEIIWRGHVALFDRGGGEAVVGVVKGVFPLALGHGIAAHVDDGVVGRLDLARSRPQR